MAGFVQLFLLSNLIHWIVIVKGISVPTSYTASLGLPLSHEGYLKPTEKVEVNNYDLSRLPPEVRELYFRLIRKLSPDATNRRVHVTGKRQVGEVYDDLSKLPGEVEEKKYSVGEPSSEEQDAAASDVVYVPIPQLPEDVLHPPPPVLPPPPPPPPPPPHAEKTFTAESNSGFKFGAGMLTDIRKVFPMFNFLEKEEKHIPFLEKGFLKHLGLELEGHSDKKIEMHEVKPVIEKPEKPHFGEMLLMGVSKLIDGAHLALEKFKKP